MNYDAYLLWQITNRCNLNCQYCVAPKNHNEAAKTINIEAVLNTLRQTGKIFRIGFTGGEPFTVTNFLDLCIAISKEHFISINTNLTTDSSNIEKLCTIAPSRVKHILVSAHVIELERHGLISRFVDNILLLKRALMPVLVIMVVHPTLIDKFFFYRDMWKQHNIILRPQQFIGTYNNKRYPDAYTDAELEQIGLTRQRFDIYKSKNIECCAGYNIMWGLTTGDVCPCSSLRTKILGNIETGLQFQDDMTLCPLDVCHCPLHIYNPELQTNAVAQCHAK